ncbi:MAG: F0F1 ATP synthase subunit epsilon, partial [Spirochaetota bacterium]
MSTTIHCSILTPEKVVFEGEADAVYVSAYDGQRGFLPGHAPMVVQLGIGMTRLLKGGHCA